MSAAPALHHFIKTLGLLRQLGEIDEVVPLLRHDQDARSPSKCPRSADELAPRPLRVGRRNPRIFLGRLLYLGQFVCGVTRESSDGSAAISLVPSKHKPKAASSSLAAVGAACGHLHRQTILAADASSKNCNPCERQLSASRKPPKQLQPCCSEIATLLQSCATCSFSPPRRAPTARRSGRP